MTQDIENKKKDTTPPWRVNFPEADKLTRHLKSSLIAACYGNERIADVLDQLTCMASYEAKNKGYPESQKIVRIKRTNQEILERLQYPTSFRSLNTYLHQLNEWGYVLSQPYQRNFDVNFETIQSAIDNPPTQPEKISNNGLQEKGGKSANLQPFKEEEKGGKVAMLQKKVANLLKKVEDLSTKVEDLSTFQTRFNALEKLVQDHIFGATMITDITTDITVNNVVARHNNALTFTLLTDEDFQDIDKVLAKSVPHQSNVQKGSASPTIAGQNNIPLMPTGNPTDRGNSPTQEPSFPPSSAFPENPEPSFLDTAIPEPPCSATDGLVQESPAMPRSETTPSESPRSAKESTSSTQAVNGTSNQATEQEKQPGSNSYSPKKATNDQPTQATLTPVPEVPKQSRRDPMNDRVKNFYDAFRLLGIEFFDDQTFKFDMTYNKKDSMHKTIVGLINDGTTPKEMRQVFQYMWDKQDKNSGEYYWRDPDHLTIRAFVRNYRTHLASVKFRTKQAENEAAKKREQGKKVAVGAGIITTGPLAGQPDYDADPWS